MLQSFKVLLLGFSLILALSIAVAPAAAQQREEIALQRLDSNLRERLMRAARVQGLRLGVETRVQITTEECPSTCNFHVVGGQCRCPVLGSTGRCPPGTRPDEQFPPESEVFCRVDPDSVGVDGPGLPPRTHLRL